MPHHYFDTHSHPLASHLEDCLPSYIQRLSVSISADDWMQQLQIQNKQTKIALGIHPWSVAECDTSVLNQLHELLETESIDAIGEIGLDFYPQFKESHSKQIDFFCKQLELAKQFSLPVSIHCLKAFDQTFYELRQSGVSGFMHGFASSEQQAYRFIDLGFKIGIGTLILNDQARKIHQLVKRVDVEHLVLETDYPFAKSPEGVYPQSIIFEIAKKVAKIKSLSVDQVVETTYQNAIQVLEK